MSEMNMTLSEFIEYAGVYEHSQQRFDMERMFMELTLVNMHLDAYDFLREANDITLGQIDCLMVESGMNDRSYASEQIFIEKGLGIVDGIKKLFSMIGKAIAAFFNKLGSIFSGGSKKSKETDKKTAEILDQANETVQKVDRMVDIATTIQDGRDLMENVVKSGEIANESVQRLMVRLNQMLGGGGVRVTGDHIDTEAEAIKPVLLDFKEIAKKIPNFPDFKDLDDMRTNVLIAICCDSHEIECLEFIAKLETVLDKLNTVFDIKVDENHSTNNYNSFWKVMNTNGAKGMFEPIEQLQEEFKAMTRRNVRITINEEVLRQKYQTAIELEQRFRRMAEICDVGPEVRGTVIDKFVTKYIASDNQQINRKEQQEADFDIRYKDDKEVYKDRGFGPGKAIVQPTVKALNQANNRNLYMRFLREMYGLAMELQRISSDCIKILSDYIKLRNACIATKQAMTDQMINIIGLVNKAMALEGQQGEQPPAGEGEATPPPENNAEQGGGGS